MESIGEIEITFVIRVYSMEHPQVTMDNAKLTASRPGRTDKDCFLYRISLLATGRLRCAL